MWRIALALFLCGCTPSGNGGGGTEPDVDADLCDPNVPLVYEREVVGPCPSYDEVVAKYGLDNGLDPCPDRPNMRLIVAVDDPNVQVCSADRHCGPTNIPWYFCGGLPILIPGETANSVAYYADVVAETFVVCHQDGWPATRFDAAYGCGMAAYADCTDPTAIQVARDGEEAFFCDEIDCSEFGCPY